MGPKLAHCERPKTTDSLACTCMPGIVPRPCPGFWCDELDNNTLAEEVRHGDVTVGVKRVFYLRSIGPVNALELQSSDSNTKLSRLQVHSQSEGLTRGIGID